ncbi:MAG: hypothetical protein AAFO02_02245 [Bacteroidota bacterium]
MRYLLLIPILLPVWLVAQGNIEFQAELGSGYEYNPFNAGPNQTMLSEDSTLVSALQSGAFLYQDLRLGWAREGKKSDFSISARGLYDYFPSLRSANLVRPGADLSYEYEFQKDKSIYTRLRYRDYQTERGADPNEVLTIPTSYRTWEGAVGYAWRPAKDTWLEAEIHARNKQFAAINTSQLRYNRLGVRGEWKQRFRKKKKPSSYLITSIDINQRVYTQERVFDEESEVEILDEEEDQVLEERLWRYQQLDVRYRFRKWGNVQLEAGLGGLNRSDVLQDRLGYRQARIFSKLRYSQGPWSLSWSTSYLYRPYTQFAAVTGEDETLLHTYWRNSILATYNLNDDWQVIMRSTTVKRWRNEAERAMNFRPYFNSMVRMGLRWKLGG